MSMIDRQKAHTRNTIFNATGEGLWGFAMAFHNMNSVIPMFLAQMGASAMILGMIPGGFILLVALPQILSATLFRHAQDVKKLNVGLHFAMTPIALMIALTYYVLQWDGQLGVRAYLTLWVVWSLGVGFLIPIWADFLASVTLPPKRGRFFGITFTVNAMMGVGGGYVLREVLASERWGFPENFGVAFLIMTGAILFGNCFFVFMKVIHTPRTFPKVEDSWWQRLAQIFKGDRNFSHYVLSRALAAVTMMPLAFYGVDLQARFDLPLSAAGTFTLFLVLGQAVSNIFFGTVGDLWGRKYAISGFFIGHILALVTAMSASAPWMAYLTFIFVGMTFGAGQSSFMVFVYEFAGEGGDRKFYYAALDTAVAPFIVVYISLAGLIVEWTSMLHLYGISLVVLLLGFLLFIVKVKAPKPLSTS